MDPELFARSAAEAVVVRMAKPISKNSEELSGRVQKLEKEVKQLRALLRQDMESALSDLPETMEVLVGTVGDDWVSVELTSVLEVIPRVMMYQIPEAPPYVGGTIHWRGAQAPVIDLSARWNGEFLPARLEDRIVVTTYREQYWGLLLSHVDHLDLINKRQLEPIPAEIPAAPYAAGLWTYRNQTVVHLSIPHLISPLLPGNQ